MFCDEIITSFDRKNWVKRVFVILLVLFTFSPWVFILIKNKTLNDISTRVSDFYNTNFSCECEKRNEPVSTNIESNLNNF